MLENQDFASARLVDPLTEQLTKESLLVADELQPESPGETRRAIAIPGVRTWVGVALLAIVALVAAAAWFAPYIYAELISDMEPHSIMTPEAPVLAKGQMVDSYWAVQKIDDQTYAIGEPRFYQGNYAYLILGSRRALLFDSGSGTRDIAPVVARLTRLPVTLLPSHLHYDHIGGAGSFSSVAMIDLPETRADVVDGRFVPGRYEFLGMVDGRQPPPVHVTEWLKPGAVIDLGGRSIEVIHTPGHTASSVSLSDRRAHQLFSGDFLYPTTLYAFLPGASLSAYQDTTSKLLATLPADTRIWAAHCCRAGENPSAPWLTMADVRALDRTLKAIAAGQIQSTGFFPRRYPVNREVSLATGFPWNNR